MYVSRRLKSILISRGYTLALLKINRFNNQRLYAAPRITPVVAKTATVVFA
eukprot:SAG22_NODE_2_length_61565_cov_858.782010_38_plen_51_part_00